MVTFGERRNGCSFPDEENVDLYVLSDCLSEVAEACASWIARRCDKTGIEITRFGSLSGEDRIMEVLDEASGSDAVVLHCFLSGEFRRLVNKTCLHRGIDQYDAFSPVLSGVEQAAGKGAKEDRALLHPMDSEYFRRVRAVEYTIAADDGGNPSILKEADVVIVGISRTGKSPLCMYLAHRGVMAANVPLVPGIEPPPQLFRIHPSRIVGLIRSPGSLGEIRTRRMSMMGLAPEESAYVRSEEILREIEYASGIMEHLGIVVFDVTRRAIEETAHEILALLAGAKERHSFHGGAK